MWTSRGGPLVSAQHDDRGYEFVAGIALPVYCSGESQQALEGHRPSKGPVNPGIVVLVAHIPQSICVDSRDV